MDKLWSMIVICVSEMRGDCFDVGVVSAACEISHVSMLMSGVCPSIWHMSVSDRPRAVVVHGWNPIRSSLIVALSSRSFSL